MKVKNTIKKYMGSFLNDNGFELSSEDSSILLFRNKIVKEIGIYFEFHTTKKAVSPQLFRGNTVKHLPSYDLTLFIDYPEQVDSVAKRDGFWYFDTKEELIGALEEQARILSKIGFDWVLNRVDYDIDAILKYYGNERAKRYKEASEREKEMLHNNIAKNLEEWRARRVKPVLWK